MGLSLVPGSRDGCNFFEGVPCLSELIVVRDDPVSTPTSNLPVEGGLRPRPGSDLPSRWGGTDTVQPVCGIIKTRS